MMSDTEDRPTQPTIEAANPTPPSMQAVTVESRLTAVERQIDVWKSAYETRETRIARIETRQDEAEKARAATDTRVTAINQKVDALTLSVGEVRKETGEIKAEMGTQTTMLRAIGDNLVSMSKAAASAATSTAGLLANPVFRKAVYSLLVSLTIIFGAVATWMTAKNSAQVPTAPAVTIITAPPPPQPPLAAPKGSAP